MSRSKISNIDEYRKDKPDPASNQENSESLGPNAKLSRVMCESVSDLLDKIENETEGWQVIWYRGLPDSNYKLEPKILRQSRIHEGLDLNFAELDARHLLGNLRRKAGFFTNQDEEKFPSIVSLAQHLRFPTPLLDWSDHLGVGLYFANSHPEADPTIWAIEPLNLNKLSDYITKNNISFEDINKISESSFDKHRFNYKIFDDRDNIVEQYLKTFEHEAVSKSFLSPIALYPLTMHRRLAHQQAGFTLQAFDRASPVNIGDILAELDQSILSKIIKVFGFRDRSNASWEITKICPNAIQTFGDEEGLFMEILQNQVWSKYMDKMNDFNTD